jgi:integrase
MSVRKRTWLTSKGAQREAWIVDYPDAGGVRRLKTFRRKKEADAFAATANVEVREGTHVADSASVTVAKAGDIWIAAAERAGLERTTLDQYRQHLSHIRPLLGAVLLSKLSTPAVTDFEDKLRDAGHSPTMVRYVVRSLGALLATAQERGLVARNVVRDLRGRRRKGKERAADRRAKGRLRIGVDIPTPAEIKAILAAAEGRWRPFLLVAATAGLRASELRGLRWDDIDFQKGELHVRQRADRYRGIGQPKTAAGERTVPLLPGVTAALKEWKLACPKIGDLGLVFPTDAGTVQIHVNIIERGLKPTQVKAGVVVPMLNDAGKPVLDKEGKPAVTAKYTGLHALRHFYASWCINRVADGGLELPAKVVQHRLGHSSIVVTLDTYGHLFPRGDDGAELAAAERALLG